MMTEREAMIDEIIAKFNFERVHLVMIALDWQWLTENKDSHEVPSIVRLKSMARHLLRNAIKHGSTGSGGFVAKYHPKVDEDPEYFQLQFILSEADSYDD